MIITRTPFRISFVGGGSDMRDFYRQSPGIVISTAINKYMYITVKKRFENTFRISYHKTEIVEKIEEIQHPIVREAIKLVGINCGLEITSIGDIPAGTGLGSSGSFTVGLLNALFALKGKLKSAEELAKLACKIEIDILKEPIGKQDQYIVAYGGMKRIQFNQDESVFVDTMIYKPDVIKKLKENLLMFYTGGKRRSSPILSEQKKNSFNNKSYIEKMKNLTHEFYNCITNGNNLSKIGKLLHKNWMLKKKLAHNISNNRIDELYQKALNAGALGGKLLGAGGDGFLLFYAEGACRNKIKKTLGLRYVPFEFESEGSKIIYIGGQ